jgi:hypothetical protein
LPFCGLAGVFVPIVALMFMCLLGLSNGLFTLGWYPYSLVTKFLLE